MSKPFLSPLWSALVVLACANSFAGGGMEGGGGEAVIPDYPTVQQIADTVRDAKLEVTMWLNDQEVESAGSEPFTPYPFLLAHFADGPGNIFDVMADLKIEVRNSEPCVSPDGRQVDGSADSSLAVPVCISAYNLSSKLSLYDYPAMTAALVLHEISHLIGADEPTAVGLQSRALKDLVYARLDDHPETLFESWLQDVSRAFQYLKVNPTTYAATRLESVLLHDDQIAWALIPRGLMVFDLKAMNLVEGNIVKAGALRDWFCSQDPSAYDQADCLKRYSTFGSSTTVLATQYPWPDGTGDPKLVGLVEIHKIVDAASRDKEIAELEKFYQDLDQYVRALEELKFSVVVKP